MADDADADGRTRIADPDAADAGDAPPPTARPPRAGADDDRDGTAAGERADDDRIGAAERLLTSLAERGVTHLFSNLGTDHTPLLEATAHLRTEDPDAYPEVVICPHEFAAMSAAHGYAAVTGDPQAVLVHVDVGTQNLGAAMHNAHRAEAPVFVIAGLAPVTAEGFKGSRDNPVHYYQDVFDQPGIVREYCRWTGEYQPPADPAEQVVRGLERATASPQGPVYLAAGREALETPIRPVDLPDSMPRRTRPSGPDPASVDRLVDRLDAADAPLVVTSDLGAPPADRSVEALVDFAEATGAGVVEHGPSTLSFPRRHPLHVGFDPSAAMADADLVLFTATDVPWLPAKGGPPADAPVVQIDPNPTKPTYPHWRFRVDDTVQADPVSTLEAAANRLGGSDDDAVEGSPWRAHAEALAAERRADLGAARERDGLTATEVSAAVDDLVDDSTVIVEGAVTSRGAVLDHLALSRPGSYVARGGSGLGWAGGAGVGIKLARPDSRVICLLGDGSYLFSNPVATAWMAAQYDAPTLSVVYNNRGWNAVRAATAAQHPEGRSVAADVPESRFGTPLDLSAPARAVGAHTARVERAEELADALAAAADAVDGGTPAVVDVAIE